jgi:hypothetical protein
LLWSAGYSQYNVSNVLTDGSLGNARASVTFTPGCIPDNTSTPAAAWTGDGLLVAERCGSFEIHVARIELDNSSRIIGPVGTGEFPTLVAGGTDVRLIYNSGGLNDWHLLRLTAAGVAVAPPVPLGSLGDAGAGWVPFWHGPAIALGGDTGMLVGQGRPGSYGFARLDENGSMRAPVTSVYSSPYRGSNGFAWDLAMRGPEVVVAWIDYPGIGLARVVP